MSRLSTQTLGPGDPRWPSGATISPGRPIASLVTSVELTDEHAKRGRALAVPGAYWNRERRHYVVDNPTPRAAAATIALFPEALVSHPELTEIRESAYGVARPHDYATGLGIRLDAGALGDKRLYSWQDTDAGYLAAILRRDGGIYVGWDRGLGKTLVTAAFILKLEARRSLVVTRNDTKDLVWRRELEEALPDHRIIILPDPGRARERTLVEVSQEDGRPVPVVFVIHYEAIRIIAGDHTVKHSDGTTTVSKGAGNGWAALGKWDLMAYDEAHRLASYNPNSRKNTQMGRALSKLRARHVEWAINLSGSGIMNRPDDLFGPLHFILPKVYRAKWKDWNDRYVDYVNPGTHPVAIGFQLDKLEALRKELGVFMVYRKKEEVFDLPPLIHQHFELDLYPKQRKVYNDMRDEFWAKLEDGGIKAANPLAQMNLLRRIATYYEGIDSVKLDFVLHELEEDPDDQFAIFTWYKAPGRALQEILGDDVVVVDGDVSRKRRTELLRKHEDGHARILVGSIATIGESLNLQYMHEAIRLDRDWNPQVNDQTVDRLYRQGQQARVTLRDLWAKDTVDTLRVRPSLASKESLRKAVFG